MNDKDNNSRGQWTSASSAAYDALCPGRHLMQRNIPEPPKGEDASFGTKVHQALAGQKVALSIDEQSLVDQCREIELKLVSQFFGHDWVREMDEDRERRYWMTISGTTELISHSGMADVVYYNSSEMPARALVVDYKSLFGEHQSTERNEQLRDLATLVYVNSGALKEVGVAIIQPRVSRTPTLTVYDRDSLHKAHKRMVDRVLASNDPDSPRIAGARQCEFCRATAVCREYQQWIGQMAEKAIALSRPQQPLMMIPLANWTPEQCATFLEVESVVGKWFEQSKKAMKARLKADPEAIPGYGLKPGNKRDIIIDAQALYNRLETLGVTIDQFIRILSVPKGQLETLVAEVTKLKGQALDGVIKTLLHGLVETKQNEPSIERAK